MKRILALAVFLLASGLLFAHPPSFRDINYDTATKYLTVQVNHDISASPVKDPTKHFMKEATINVNGTKVLVQSYTSQEGPKGLTIVCRLVLGKGDKVDVAISCSLSGEATASYLIP
jgi:hypothetical protein